EIAAAFAVTDALHRLGQRRRQPPPTLAFAFEHVISHALRGLLANARQHAERFDQLFEYRHDGDDQPLAVEKHFVMDRSSPAVCRCRFESPITNPPITAPQNGIFMPGGSGMPAVADAILSLDMASTLLD